MERPHGEAAWRGGMERPHGEAAWRGGMERRHGEAAFPTTHGKHLAIGTIRLIHSGGNRVFGHATSTPSF